jgi:hypothetical protein
LSECDIFKKYNVSSYLTDYALCTKKAYRECGIATEMIKARTQMMKAFDVTVTSTGYTVIGSQKAAEKAGHSEGYRVSYSDLQKKFADFDFSNSNAEYLKVFDFKL